MIITNSQFNTLKDGATVQDMATAFIDSINNLSNNLSNNLFYLVKALDEHIYIQSNYSGIPWYCDILALREQNITTKILLGYAHTKVEDENAKPKAYEFYNMAGMTVVNLTKLLYQNIMCNVDSSKGNKTTIQYICKTIEKGYDFEQKPKTAKNIRAILGRLQDGDFSISAHKDHDSLNIPMTVYVQIQETLSGQFNKDKPSTPIYEISHLNEMCTNNTIVAMSACFQICSLQALFFGDYDQQKWFIIAVFMDLLIADINVFGGKRKVTDQIHKQLTSDVIKQYLTIRKAELNYIDLIQYQNRFQADNDNMYQSNWLDKTVMKSTYEKFTVIQMLSYTYDKAIIPLYSAYLDNSKSRLTWNTGFQTYPMRVNYNEAPTTYNFCDAVQQQRFTTSFELTASWKTIESCEDFACFTHIVDSTGFNIIIEKDVNDAKAIKSRSVQKSRTPVNKPFSAAPITREETLASRPNSRPSSKQHAAISKESGFNQAGIPQYQKQKTNKSEVTKPATPSDSGSNTIANLTQKVANLEKTNLDLLNAVTQSMDMIKLQSDVTARQQEVTARQQQATQDQITALSNKLRSSMQKMNTNKTSMPTVIEPAQSDDVFECSQEVAINAFSTESTVPESTVSESTVPVPNIVIDPNSAIGKQVQQQTEHVNKNVQQVKKQRTREKQTQILSAKIANNAK